MNASSMAVVGRDVELAALDAFLTSAQSEFSLLTLEGEPGIGKTTIWREALRRATSRGTHVLTTRPTEAEAALSFAALADLFAAVDDTEIDRLSTPQREAIAAALLRDPAPERGIDERALFAAVLSLLRLLSAEAPLLVAVDDAQWLDAPSARALEFVVRRLHAEPIAFLVTHRIGARAATFDRAADPERRRTVRLGPLTVAALHEAIKERTGRSLPRPVMVQLATASGGNPFYALEIAAELGDRPLEAGRLPLPASLSELVASRVKRLPLSTRSALLTAAVLSRPTIDEVDRGALELAERAGIVSIESRQIRFAHPLFASAIQAQAGNAECRRVHARLAHELTEPEERARHAALGSDQPDDVIAAQLEEAAVTARARGAPVAAAELFELSIERTPPGKAERRTVRQVSAAKSWFDAGDLGRAEAMLMQVTAGPLAASIRARALGLLAQLHSRRSSFALALAVGQEALEAATGDDALSADLEMDVGYFCVSLGDIPGSLEHAQRALVAAERTGARGVLADALGVTAVLQFMAGGGLDEDRVRRARELEDPTRERTWQMSPEFTYGCMLLYSGRLDEALLVLGRLHADSLDRGQESPIPYSCFWLAWAHVWRGDFAAARRCADESSKAAALLEDPAAHAFALTTSALVHAHDGSTDDARREALEAVHRLQELGWLVGSVYALWALGIAELSSGNPAAVDAALGPLSAQVTALPAGDPLFGLFLPEEVEALVELGELDRADSLLQWLEQRASALDRAWARAAAGRCRGLLCTARGDSDRGVVVLEDALAQHARSDMPFERARTLLVKGQVHRRRKEKRLATAALREAQQTFARLGARQWALKATAELSRLGLRPSKADELTPTERRIAELAVAGLANSEIAERAFLTTKTVEANLTRVYHKLGIRSRGGLARALQSAVESTHE